jgi:glutathione S-transferase
MSQKPRLYTFAISHFSEKIRWTLDVIGMEYEEVPWTPVLHVPRALLKAKRTTTVPILEVGHEAIQDSTRILMWLEQNRAPFRLLPSDPDQRQAVLEIEQRFDVIGKHVIRYLYDAALHDLNAVLELWTVHSTPLEKRSLELSMPWLESTFRSRFKITAAEVARSRQLIDENLAWLEARVANKGPYLHGEQLSAADITAAALLAPAACPPEHPLYSSANYQAGVAQALAPFADRPGLRWVRDMYQRHRRTKLG